MRGGWLLGLALSCALLGSSQSYFLDEEADSTSSGQRRSGVCGVLCGACAKEPSESIFRHKLLYDRLCEGRALSVCRCDAAALRPDHLRPRTRLESVWRRSQGTRFL